tara:strand:+ start:1855 stop:2967 length:1113 start_codon:yes stop_codon:yes gene_type:complete
MQDKNNVVEYSKALPISIRGLTKRYGSLYALNSIDLDVSSGEFLTLLGPSGSGKTTLLMAIAGFNRPDSGSIRFGDSEMILAPPHKREVGMVFQNYALFPHMTVAENIGFPLKLRKIGSKECQQRVDEALSTVQLLNLGDRRIDQLSGGQKQRVALARAFVFRPRILLMDEPLSALDKKLREQMQIELKQLHRKLGVTTVYVTHDQREALTMSDRIAVINEGKFEQIDSPEFIYNKPANSFVADFIGESTMLPLGKKTSGDLFFQDILISSGYSNSSQEEWLLVIRPERLFLVEKNNLDSDQNIIFEGVIKEFVYQGETAFALIALSDQHSLSIRFSTDSSGSRDNMRPGESLKIGLKRSEVIIIPENSN